jgi:D-alanine-D-alanine ligase
MVHGINPAPAVLQRRKAKQTQRAGSHSFRNHPNDFLVWILAPMIETQDANLQYYYDYTQSHAEYERVFEELGCAWQWQNVTMASLEEVIRGIKSFPTNKTKVVVNLCDGDEDNGIPGVSVIDMLERYGLVYTGSDRSFYTLTTSKIPMKRAFDEFGVPTPAWREIVLPATSWSSYFRAIGRPIIVKPAVSAGSMGLGVRNVVEDTRGLKAITAELQKGYRGWKLDAGGVIAEAFVPGREFTTLVVGSSSHPGSLHFYPPAERVFHDSLPENEKFLSFDRLWETYDSEKPIEDNGHLYEYRKVESSLIPTLRALSLQAFAAVGGMGYGRLDIRMDGRTGQCYVLEVNAQCGLSEDEDYTSIGAILRFAKKSFTYLVIEIIEDGITRYGAKHNA